jgi:hypothetical protein
MKHLGVAVVIVLLPVLAAAPAHAQQPARARVQLHVGGDPDLRQPALTHLRAALQPSRDIVLVERDPEYVLSVIVLPIASGGFAVSAAALSAHTEASLAALANGWGIGAPAAERMAATFRGQGALLDQRVLTGPELEPLCGDVARALATDTIARARKP